MIQVQGLTKKIGSVQVLNGVELNIQAGDVYCLWGEAGTGKSTLINILAGLTRPDNGFCLVNDWDLEKIAHPGDLHIGYLPQGPEFCPWLTGLETLHYLGGRLPPELMAESAESLLRQVGLDAATGALVRSYSRDMLQRLGLAAALLNESPLLLLDEPFSLLAAQGRANILQLINNQKDRNRTVLLTTRSFTGLAGVCDHIGILKQGRVTVELPVDSYLKGGGLAVDSVDI